MADQVGEYAIHGVLGRGAHGIVYRASDAGGKAVALKMLHTRHGEDPELRARFDRECRLSEGVHHPNVVECYAHGELDGQPWLASELVACGSLESRLRRGRLDDDATMRVAVALFSGLGAIHAAGLIHRDIKPANLLFASDGTLKIADLGLARPTEVDRTRFTMTGGVIGTPSYIAPEQITDGDSADIRADLYSAGITLYECLAGDVPFQADVLVDLMLAHLDNQPPPLGVVPGVPPAVATFIHRLLAKKPAGRFADPAAALAVARGLVRSADCALLDLLPPLRDGLPDLGDIPLELASTLPPTPLAELAGLATGPRAAVNATRGMPTVLTVGGGIQPSAVRVDRDGSRLFCYAGPRVVLGREAPRTDPFQVCLRLLPALEHADRTLRLSSRHLQVIIGADGVVLRDLNSSLGTVVNGRTLASGGQQLLTGRTEVRLADVLDLVIRVVPSAGRHAVGALSGDLDAPSVLITRKVNGATHRYLVVGGTVDLDHPRLATGSSVSGRGDVLIAAGGGLWRRVGDRAVAVCDAPSPFTAITPEHHKD